MYFESLALESCTLVAYSCGNDDPSQSSTPTQPQLSSLMSSCQSSWTLACMLCRAEVPHVASALEAMVKLCSDPQLIVDFFVNYDCDLQVGRSGLGAHPGTLLGISACFSRPPHASMYDCRRSARCPFAVLQCKHE